MASERTPIGFSLYQLLTRIIPGLLIVVTVLPISFPNQALDFILADSETFTSQAEYAIGTILDLYLWIPILVLSIIAGQFINAFREWAVPVPNYFRLFLYESEGDRSVLSFKDYMWGKEFKENPDNTGGARLGPQALYLLTVVYLSIVAGLSTNSLSVGVQVLLILEAIGFPLILFRNEIKTAIDWENRLIYSYFNDNPNSYFDSDQTNEIVQSIRNDCGFGQDVNDPEELFFGMNANTGEYSNSVTSDLELLYHFNKNFVLALYGVGAILLLTIVFGGTEQQLVSFFILILMYPIVILYFLNIPDLNIDRKYTQSLILEYVIKNRNDDTTSRNPSDT
ncbi:hypothetical protein [Natrarchaeobaculum sulfurireducens]|uniref:hypothetical protein n=1 Tax=Natrarchaeobaculum sulfurireducens TaxID=2044521 RepID=UPI00105AB0DF|nr:hypothetical protein [Natrarchaeobaculum sulfurireducens]